MKKAIIFALALLGAATAFASSSTYKPTLPPGLTGKLSTNVVICYVPNSTDQSGYSVGTYHTSGTKTFASSSGDATIWVSNTTGQQIPDAPQGTGTANWGGADWTSI